MYGIREKQLNVIRFKYNKMKSRMKTTRKQSDVFQNSLGFALRGGFEPPLFLSVYVNDQNIDLFKNNIVPLQVQKYIFLR